MIHVVRPGECLSSIATSYGYRDWRIVYDHPQNAGFRAKRQNPNIILPNDEIFIPTKAEASRTCATGQTHVFRLTAARTLLRLAPQDATWSLCPGRRFRLEVEGAPPTDGVIPDDGLIEVPIPSDAATGTLTVWIDEAHPDGQSWELRLGALDPVESMTGIQARLNNLGFDCGPVDGDCGPLTRAAVRAFQERHGLTIDGIPGPLTQAKLEEVHGC
jgi:N-acetylmuramoyl-L-alanine amidase